MAFGGDDMFIATRIDTPLALRRSDISGLVIHCYKHIVPTGLKRVSHIRPITKLTLMVRLENRTDRLESS